MYFNELVRNHNEPRGNTTLCMCSSMMIIRSQPRRHRPSRGIPNREKKGATIHHKYTSSAYSLSLSLSLSLACASRRVRSLARTGLLPPDEPRSRTREGGVEGGGSSSSSLNVASIFPAPPQTGHRGRRPPRVRSLTRAEAHREREREREREGGREKDSRALLLWFRNGCPARGERLLGEERRKGGRFQRARGLGNFLGKVGCKSGGFPETSAGPIRAYITCNAERL